MSEWQPIESFPAIGKRRVLIFQLDAGEPWIVIGHRWPDGAWQDDTGDHWQPTHWMPLPEPPKLDDARRP